MQAVILVIYNLSFMVDSVRDFGCLESIWIQFHIKN